MNYNLKNEKGITLIALVITIIVMIIISGVATYSGIQTIESVQKTAFISEMEMIQAKINAIYEERKNDESKVKYYNSIGQDISFANQTKVAKALGETTVEGFRYFQSKDLEKINLSDINQDVLINYDTREVISLKGTKINGVTYYKLKDIPNYIGYNIEYTDKNTKAPSFTISKTKLSDNEYRLTIKDIVYNSNVKGGIVKYKLHSETNWILNGEDTSFTITKPGLYDICFTDKAGNETIKQELVNKFDYTGEGLLAYYDAENNTEAGHNETTTIWKDLTGNGYDGELKNFNSIVESGWTNNSLVFDGSDDFATIRNLDLSKYNDITICATYKILSIPNNKAVAVLSSDSSSNGRIFFGYGNNYLNYVVNSNTYASNFTEPDIWIYGDNNLAEIGKINSIITTYSGQSTTSTNRIYSNNNLVITNNTVMTSKWGSYNLDIGRTFGDNLDNHLHANIELYNLFIYEGALDENKIQHNYEIDKYRFGITE